MYLTANYLAQLSLVPLQRRGSSFSRIRSSSRIKMSKFLHELVSTKQCLPGWQSQGKVGEELLDRPYKELDGVAICTGYQFQVDSVASQSSGCQCRLFGMELLFELSQQPIGSLYTCTYGVWICTWFTDFEIRVVRFLFSTDPLYGGYISDGVYGVGKERTISGR
jgi:hypothetical protein